MTWNNKTDVVIDIETIVEPVTEDELMEYMLSYKPPGNYKDPEKIAIHKAEFEKTAVNDLTESKRFSIGGKKMISCALGVVGESSVLDISSWASDDLQVITRGVADYLSQQGEYRLIGWNHKTFDLPELAKSFRKTGIKLDKRPGKWDLIDLCDYPYKRSKLKEVAKAHGLELLVEDGSSIARLHSEGDWNRIKTYNEHDVYLTGEIYLAASTIFSF